MDKSTPRATSRIFIAGFRNFDLVYLPAEQEVVSRFHGDGEYSWTATSETTAHDAE
jgi:hypothetical protein